MATNGGISYEEIMDSGLMKISLIQDAINKINREIEKKSK